MMTFRYEGLNVNSERVEGIIEANDKQDAVVRARERCRVLLNVEPVGSVNAKEIMNLDIGMLLSGGKVKPKKLAILCSQLAIELRAGLPLVQSLRLVAENEEDKTLKKIVEEVAEDVYSGHGLAESFARRGPKLPVTFIETVRAGEASGRLDECFERLKKYYEDSAAVAAKVGSAMVYPAILISVAVVVVAIIMIFAVPVFEESFASLGTTLPLPTRILIGISHFFTNNILLLIAIVAAFIVALILFRKTDVGQHFFAKLALTFPGIKLVNRMNAAAQTSATLSTMLASGLPLTQAVSITAATASNLLIQEDYEAAGQGVYEGHRLSTGLRKSLWLPKLLVEMLAVGEQTGQMEDTLIVVSDYYNKEVDEAVKRALDILNPAITMVLAGIVVFILLAVYMPIFSLYGSI